MRPEWVFEAAEVPSGAATDPAPTTTATEAPAPETTTTDWREEFGRYAAEKLGDERWGDPDRMIESFQHGRNVIASGKHKAGLDEEDYEALGLDQPEPEPFRLAGGTPTDLTDIQGLTSLAENDPHAALKFLDRHPGALEDAGIDEDAVRAQILGYWQQHDQNGPWLYAQQKQRADLDALREELRGEYEGRIDPFEQKEHAAHLEGLVASAHEQIPGFDEAGVIQIVSQWAPEQLDQFNALTPAEQLQQLNYMHAMSLGLKQMQAATAASAKQAATTTTTRGAAALGTQTPITESASRAKLRQMRDQIA